MVLQVYTSQKPALPRRAMIGSIALLVSACLLAATLTNRRTESLVDEPVKPPDWSITFRPPRLFQFMEQDQVKLGSIFVFSGKTRNGSQALLFAYQISPPMRADAADVCRTVLNETLWQEHRSQQRQTPEAIEELLGDLGAMQISDPTRGVIVRATIVSKNEAYAIALQVHPGMLDSWAVDLFDQVCDSVQRVAD